MAAGALTILLLLSACGPGANAAPTVSVEAVYTAAYQTLIAQQATQEALNPPTSTPLPPTAAPPLPLPSPLPTLAFASPTARFTGGGGGTACDNAGFVSDVTIPDNTVLQPGKSFTKTWALINNGTCTWDTTYKLAFQSGDQMGGATAPLTGSVPPGSTLNISVKMTAPTTNGTYKGTWQMQNGANQFFGVAPYVLIKVGGGATATSGPSPTGLPGCANSKCTIFVSANVGGFTITITDISKVHLTECDPGGGNSCSFTVPMHWDGKVTIGGKKYTWSPSDTCTFTDVTTSKSCTFTGTPQNATNTPKP